MINYKTALFGAAFSAVLSTQAMFGGAIVAGFDSSTLAANDDSSTGFVSFGLGTLNFYGTSITGAYLNNNGNMTFGGPLSTYTPFGITGGSTMMIAPFFADVDTTGVGSGLMKYGTGTFGGHAAFGQTWVNVGYFSSGVDKLNSFQTLIVDRSDVAAGDFDLYFNYDKIQWETGGASGGTLGLGGSSAHVGFTNGAGSYVELAGSGINGALLDGGPNSLTAGSLNTGVAGSYLFTVRSGLVSGVPDAGATVALLGLALLGFVGVTRKFRA